MTNLNIKQGVVEQCRVLALSARGDVLHQTPTRHTSVGLEKARIIINWQGGWLKRKYPELSTRGDVTYKLQWLVNGNWKDHDGFDNTRQRKLNPKEATESSKRTHIRQREMNLGPKFTELRRTVREATRQVISDPPPIPRWIRSFPSHKIDGWTNKFSLMPKDPNLYAESLRADWKTQFDDWKGNVLLLAKDLCPTEELQQMVERRVSFLHRAQSDLGDEKRFGTNNKLYDFASVIPGGKLFGSACANMLCDKSGYRRNIFKEFCPGPLHGYFKDVLSWVVDTMPNVDWIACLGKEAWFLTCATMGDLPAASQFSEYRESYRAKCGVIAGKNVVAFPLFHPAALGTYINEMPKGWRALGKLVAKKGK